MTTEPAADPAALPSPGASPRRSRAAARGLGALLMVVLLLATMTAAALWWLAARESGTAWLLTRLPGVSVVAPRGALLGDFSAAEVTVRFMPAPSSAVLRNVGWRGLHIGRSEVPGAWARLDIAELRADRIDVQLAPSAPDPNRKPPQPPASLELPLELDIGALRVGELHAAALGALPLRDLRARVHLGADGGSTHRIDDLALSWDRLQASGSLHVGTRGDMPLDARLQVAQAAAAASGALPAVDASATLAGPLRHPALQATARVLPQGGAPQTLNGQAALAPFAAWPLTGLQLNLREFDVAALASAAPHTSLSGDATVSTTASNEPASARIHLVNDAAGRWDEARLPVREVRIDLEARPDDPRTLGLRAFDVLLGAAAAPAGRLQGTGRWTPAAWQLDATLAALRPAALDARAPAMELSGPLALHGSIGNAQAAGATDATTLDVKADLRGEHFAGALPAGAPRSAELRLDASLNPRRVELRELRATAGGASLLASAVAERDTPGAPAGAGASAGAASAPGPSASGPGSGAPAAAPWKVKGSATLADFDPRRWWPGADDDPAWRAGPSRLNAHANVDATVPAALSDAASELFAALRGEADVSIRNSTLAGVALDGELALRSSGNASALATLKLDAAGNHVDAKGRLATSGDGKADRWELALDGPALERLAPLYRLAVPNGADARVAGNVKAHATLAGRWPAIDTEGEFDAQGVRVGAASMQRGQGRWTLGSAADARIDVQLAVDDAVFARPPAPVGTAPATGPDVAAAGNPSIESVRLALQGTARDHRLDLRAVSKALPPAWFDALQGRRVTVPAAGSAGAVASSTLSSAAASAASPFVAAPAVPGSAARQARGGGTQLARVAGGVQATSAAPALPPLPSQAGRTVAVLRAQGGLTTAGSLFEPTGWRGNVQQLDVRSGAASTRPLLQAQPVGIDAQWAGATPRVAVQPGRIDVIGASLRWQRLFWQAAAGAAPAQIDVQATLDPLDVAPFLASAQPEFGWGGDLALRGHADIHSAPTFSADVVIERSGGDLTVTDEVQTHALGLTELRLGLAARDGVWNFTQALAGKTVGVASGAVVVRTSPTAVAPPADAALEGVIEARVADLGTLGDWVAPGWRIGGALHAKASFGGRVGAPEVTGRVDATQLAMRNFLQGVNVSDGDLAITLKGTSAHIERFTARAGDGTLRVDGDAALGATPSANLNVVAEKFQALGRVDRRIVASGRARVAWTPAALAVTGRFDVDEGLVDVTQADAPRLADDVVIVRAAQRVPTAAQASAVAQAPPSSTKVAVPAAAPAAAAAKVDVDLQVGLGEKLRLRGRGLASGLRGDLHITAPAGRLAINGTVRTEGGNYNAYGQKLTIDRGLISFAGPVDNPRLDIEATRPKLDIRVGVAISGTAQNPRIRLFSEPELSEVDKLSWLVMGRASDGLGRTDTALLQRAALALVSGGGSGDGESSTDKFTKAIGLDELSVGAGAGSDVRSAVVTLGKQLSDRWFVGYEQSLNAIGGSFQLTYRVAQRFKLRAQSGTDNSLDAIWSWRWQ